MEMEKDKRKDYWKEVWDVSKDETIAELEKEAKFRKAVDDYAKRKEEERKAKELEARKRDFEKNLKREKEKWNIGCPSLISSVDARDHSKGFKLFNGVDCDVLCEDYCFYIDNITSNVNITGDEDFNIQKKGDSIFIKYVIYERSWDTRVDLEKGTLQFKINKIHDSLLETVQYGTDAVYIIDTLEKIKKNFSDKVKRGEINRNVYLLNHKDENGRKIVDFDSTNKDYRGYLYSDISICNKIAKDAMSDEQKKLSELRVPIRSCDKIITKEQKTIEEYKKHIRAIEKRIADCQKKKKNLTNEYEQTLAAHKKEQDSYKTSASQPKTDE